MKPADIIILLIVIVAMVFAARKAAGHFKGDSLCCGGGDGSSKKPKRKFLDGPVLGTRTLRIEDMHCQHCVDSVTNALNEIDGVVAEVDLKKEIATVSYDRSISDGDLREAVKKAGFTCLNIS